MKEWRLVVLLCTALLCEPVWSQEKWSRPETAEKRIDDWVPITATCPSCQKNLEPNTAGGIDEVGSLLNPPAVPSARSSFNFNVPQTHFKRAPAGEPYEATTPPPPPSSAQFFNQQQAPKIPQPVHFPVPFFGQQNPFQARFQGLPNFQPQFTFIPQSQIQTLPKENKVTFPDSPFIQQQNKGSVQLVYVPIEALQRQKPRFQADRPAQQQTQLDVKTQSPFDNDKLRFQRPPQQIEQTKPRFPTTTQFEQETNRFAPPPASFEQESNRFQQPPQLFEQGKPNFPAQLKEQRPEFLPQNEQPVAPQSYQFVEDARNPPSNFFQFHDNRFAKPSFEIEKPKQPKQQVPQNFAPNFDESRQESAQNIVPNFDANRPRQGPPQQLQFLPNFQETRPRQEPAQQPQFVPNFQETKPRQEPPQQLQFLPNFQETKPRQEPAQQPQFAPSFQETRPRQESSLPPQFVQNFQENRPRQESPPPQQQPEFVSKFEQPKLEPQQQFIPNFEEKPQQETAQQTFVPNFESLRPKPEVLQNFAPNFQETRPKQETFAPNFEDTKFKSKPKTQLPPSLPPPQQSFNLPSSAEQIAPPSTPYPPPHQPPLSVYMEKRLDNRVNEVLTILQDAKTIPVLDTIGDRSPKVFVGPSDLDAPRGYVKFELPYLSSLDITKIDTMADRLPFFVAPLNFKPPFGYAKIPFPPPHIGSVVVSSKSPPVAAVASSTEFVPFTLTSQLPTEVNSLQPSVSSTTQRVVEKPISTSSSVASSTPKRNRQRKPLHRGSLTSFSTTTPVNDIAENQRDQFTTPSELQQLPENRPGQQKFVEGTQKPIRQKFSEFSRKPVEQQQTVFESTQSPPVQQEQKQSEIPQQQQPQFDSPQQQQQQFDSPQQQQQQFDSPQQQQQQFDSPQQFFADQQVPQTQQEYLDTLPQLTQQQFFNNQEQPNQQQFFENQPQPTQQFVDEPSQTIQDQVSNNNQESNQQQQFISSSTEKQIFKNFQQVQPLSQYQVGNNFLNQQQSSTEQIQSASNPPQTVSSEPQTLAPPTDTPKLRQRLSYYDKLMMSSTQASVESTSVQDTIETSEKPRERPKLKPRQRLTTTRKPTTESSAASEEIISEQAVTEASTQRYNPLKRRRPTTTTTTTEQTETTRNPLRSRTTQAGRSDFVRSRSRRPTTTTTTTTTTTSTTEAPRQYEDANDDQKKIEEAASFWNEPVTIQQSQGYELDATRYTQAPSASSDGGRYNSGEPPAEQDNLSKEKYGNEKKAHDPNSEKKAPGRRGHWVRVRVKKPQDGLDTAESQNSLGPLSVNAIRELATKPTADFDAPSSTTAEPAAEPATEPATESTPSTTSSSTTTTTTAAPTTTTTTVSPPPTTTAVFEEEGAPQTTVVDERLAAETTVVATASSTTTRYPDDEQDEAFQRNLADMLAKFIGGGNEPPQLTTTAATVTPDDESTGDLSDVEMTVVPSVVTETPIAPVTSTTTKVSMETEICYKGRCVKSKKNKPITDLLPEP